MLHPIHDSRNTSESNPLVQKVEDGSCRSLNNDRRAASPPLTGPVYINTTSTICLLYVRDSKVQQLGGDFRLPHTSDEFRIFFWGCDTRDSESIWSIRGCVVTDLRRLDYQ